jgi:hypothetical protein
MRKTAALLIVALAAQGCATTSGGSGSSSDDNGFAKAIGVILIGAAAIAGARRGGGFTPNAYAAAPTSTDYEWDWDEIQHPTQAGSVWVCRGVQTGQFADSDRCAYRVKTDLRWPGWIHVPGPGRRP